MHEGRCSYPRCECMHGPEDCGFAKMEVDMTRGSVKLTPENCPALPKHDLVCTYLGLPKIYRCECGYWETRTEFGAVITRYKKKENTKPTSVLTEKGKY